MSETRWKPSVTVAAVVQQQGRYLVVEERTPDGLRLNNPAGHLDPGESIVQGVVRETLEETACVFSPEALVGVYLARLQRGSEDITYLRFAICGSVGEPLPGRVLDEPVERRLWLTLDELRASAPRHRSPLLLRCVEDHALGLRYPLQSLVMHDSVHASVRASVHAPAPGPG